MAGDRTRSFEVPIVHEAIVFRESLIPKDDFGYPQVKAPVMTGTEIGVPTGAFPNYSASYARQLEFHERELAGGLNGRCFPEAMLNYHLGKIATLSELLGVESLAGYRHERI